MITYQMPKGVEHYVRAGLQVDFPEVITYQMPKGVEHLKGLNGMESVSGDYIPDAERR